MTSSIDRVLGDDPPERARVTSHAILAFQERRDPMDPYPASTLRSLWRQSEPTDRPATREADGLYLIYDVSPRGEKAVILTCYPISWEDRHA